MRKNSLMKKLVSGIMALAVSVVLVPAMDVQAASEYTVTFRPGNVGQFGIASEDNSMKTVKDMAQEVADIYYAQYETTVTENGAIKVKVSAGAAMPATPGYVIPDEGYCVRAWGPEQGETVRKNVDYVVDYGRLIDGVEYTVKYVDEESGESLAPFATAYANIGDTVSVNAPATITTSDAGEYVLTSAATQELTLTADAASNVITFTYAYNYDPGTVTEDVIVNVPGDTVVNTETVTTYVDNGTTVVPGATVIQGADADANADADAENQDADAQGGETPDAEDENAGDQGTVEIEEDETPLADGSGDAEDELVSIEDEEAPLSALEREHNGNAAIIVASVFGVAAVALAAVWLQSRRKKADVEE